LKSALREGKLRLKTQGSKAARSLRDVPAGSSKQSEPTSGVGLVQPGESTTKERKRGRPQKIPDERKAKAAELKAAGGTNKQAAAEIYNTKYPTDQQKKNVPAILRYHQRKSEQSGLPVSTRSSTLKPSKTNG
jgi:hypothetical protein